MKRLFVDTGAWDAIADGADSNHELALLYRDEIAGQCYLVTTNYVLDELYTLLLMNIGHRATVKFKQDLELLIREKILEVVWVSEEVAMNAWDVFEQFNEDKRWSFTDCTSYTIMKEYGLTDVFAFDHHFDQMGFVRKP